MVTLVHELVLDFGASGTFDLDGTVDGLAAYTVDGLAGLTVDDLGLIASGEDVSGVALGTPEVTVERGRDRIAGHAPPLANEVSFSVDNRSGAYSPTNAGSPLYPNVAVGRAARWRIDHLGVLYPVAHGYLTEIAPHPGYGEETVGMLALSQLARLVDKRGYSSPLYGDGTQANGIRTSVALGYVLDAAGLTDTALRAFDVADTLLNWFVIRPDDELFDLAVRLVASEGAGARLYDDANGVTTFKRRTAEVVESRSTTVQATYRDTDNGTDPWYVDWEPDAGEKNIVNRCSIEHVRRAVDAVDAAFWVFGATVVLGASEARAFQVQSTSDDPIASVVALAAGTDYTVGAGSVASAVYDRTSGPFVTLTITAGAGGATLTGLQVRGKLARVTATTQVTNAVTAAVAASVLQFGPQPMTLPTFGELDYLVAQSLCDEYVTRGMQPRATAVIEVPLGSDVLALATLPREVGERVAVVNARSAFAQAMWVESVRVVAGAGTRVFLGCATCFETDYLLWDLGNWDDNTWAV